MKNRPLAQAIAVLLCALLASPLFSPLSGADRAAAVGRIVSAPPVTVNGLALPADATLLSGDRLSTGPEGWARVLLGRGEQIHLDAQSEASARQAGDRLEIELAQGRVTLRTQGDGVLVRSNGLEITPTSGAEALWQVARLSDDRALVTAQQGRLTVQASNQTVEVLPGQSLQMQTRLMAEDDQEPEGAEKDAGISSKTKKVIGVVLVAATATAISVPLALEDDDEVVSPSGL